jgi:hypothetical protein
MGNMSYCRYHNTALDLGDCLEAIFLDGNRALEEASMSERDGLKDLLNFCKSIAEDYDDLIEEALEAWEEDNE